MTLCIYASASSEEDLRDLIRSTQRQMTDKKIQNAYIAAPTKQFVAAWR